jgi:hypothetical protein
MSMSSFFDVARMRGRISAKEESRMAYNTYKR